MLCTIENGLRIPALRTAYNLAVPEFARGLTVARFSALDAWFRPKSFESERFYEPLDVRILKRYVPTGGDLVMRRLRRDHPGRRWVTSTLQSLRSYEKRTRLDESFHVIGFIALAILAAHRFASGSLTAVGLVIALALDLILGLWPVVLQRYNRLRLYRAINRFLSLSALKDVGPR